MCLLDIDLSDTRKTQGVEGDVKEGSASHWEKGEGGVEGEGQSPGVLVLGKEGEGRQGAA